MVAAAADICCTCSAKAPSTYIGLGQLLISFTAHDINKGFAHIELNIYNKNDYNNYACSHFLVSSPPNVATSIDCGASMGIQVMLATIFCISNFLITAFDIC